MANLLTLRDIQATNADVLGKDYFDPTGREAYALNNEKIGKINGALVEESTGKIRYFIVDVGGWFSSKEVLVPAGLARIEGDNVYFDSLTKDQAGAMNAYDLNRTYNYDEQAQYDRTIFNQGSTPRQLAETDYRAPSTLELLEERLTVNKDRIVAGVLELRKRVVAEQQAVNVQLTEEEAHIQRTAVNQPTNRTIGEDDGVVRVELEAERANVSKQTYVAEQVNVDKVAQTRTETFNETVRHEELDVQKDGVERTDLRDVNNTSK